MTNEDNNVVETVEETQEDTQEESNTEETTSSKSEESPADKKARLERQLKQLGKKNPELFEEVETTKKSTKSNDLDYGQKAYLVANGIKGSDEMQLVKDIMSETGKSLEQVLESKYFQADLKEMRELNATEEATVGSSKRSGNSSVDTVEYWIAKGELPPKSETKLRQDVVNARLKADKSTGVFYNS